jgi:hypothetical protein
LRICEEPIPFDYPVEAVREDRAQNFVDRVLETHRAVAAHVCRVAFLVEITDQSSFPRRRHVISTREDCVDGLEDRLSDAWRAVFQTLVWEAVWARGFVRRERGKVPVEVLSGNRQGEALRRVWWYTRDPGTFEKIKISVVFRIDNKFSEGTTR